MENENQPFVLSEVRRAELMGHAASGELNEKLRAMFFAVGEAAVAMSELGVALTKTPEEHRRIFFEIHGQRTMMYLNSLATMDRKMAETLDWLKELLATMGCPRPSAS